MSSGAGHWITGNLGTVIAGAALLVTIITWLIDHQRKRRLITYRVHMDRPITAAPTEHSLLSDVTVKTRGGEDVPQASLVLIRVANKGGVDVAETHFDRGGPKFIFEGREVKDFDTFEIQGSLDEALKPAEKAEPATADKPGKSAKPGVSFSGDTLTIPPLNINIDDRFKLLVLLSGRGTGVKGKTHIVGGKFDLDKGGRVLDERTRIFAAVSLALSGALLAFLVSGPGNSNDRSSAFPCATGHITIDGSTAFEPAVYEIAGDYHQACPGANITVNGNGSIAGINALNSGAADAAMFDGTEPAGAYPRLVSRPVALVDFAVVLNKQVGLVNLSTGQLQGIYSLKYVNWDQLNGPNLPIVIVGRDSQSGTRYTFQNTILGGQAEPGANSPNCVTANPGPKPPVLICETDSTTALLDIVNNTPGAIGYAELHQAKASPNVRWMLINGQLPSIELTQQSGYPFRATEHIYTRGQPAQGSLLAAFLSYLTSETAKAVMNGDQVPACGSLPPALEQVYCGS
jgi:phosphate transport system substrate-binding protein